MAAEPSGAQGLSADEADQANRYLAAMSLALEHIAITDDADDLESLWRAYFTNQKNLNDLVPQARAPEPDSFLTAAHPTGGRRPRTSGKHR